MKQLIDTLALAALSGCAGMDRVAPTLIAVYYVDAEFWRCDWPPEYRPTGPVAHDGDTIDLRN